MNPAAVYLRVSKDDGTQTTDNQRPDVLQMASGRGYAVAPEHVFIDEASGAKGADERPALRALLEGAARGKFRAVFVWRLDRLSRDDSFKGGLMMVGDLDRFGVALLSHQETWLDTSGPFRGVLVQIALTLAAEERRTLIQRTRAGIDRARRQGTRSGKAIGRPPAQISDAVRLRGRQLRVGGADAFGVTSERDRSWRRVAELLELEGFQGLPSHASIARACTKPPGEI